MGVIVLEGMVILSESMSGGGGNLSGVIGIGSSLPGVIFRGLIVHGVIVLIPLPHFFFQQTALEVVNKLVQ